MQESAEYDCIIFTHIPKCGGTSIRKYLNDSCKQSGISRQERYIPGYNLLSTSKNYYSLSGWQKRRVERKNAKVWAMHVPFGWHEVLKRRKNPFYMCIARNPIERVISHYNYFYKGLGYEGFANREIGSLSEREVEQVLTKTANVQVSYISGGSIKGGKATTDNLESAIANVESGYHFVGTVETLAKDLDLFRKNCPGWFSPVEKLTKENTSQHSSEEQEVEEDIIDRIREKNELDMRLYDFIKKVQI